MLSHETSINLQLQVGHDMQKQTDRQTEEQGRQGSIFLDTPSSMLLQKIYLGFF